MTNPKTTRNIAAGLLTCCLLALLLGIFNAVRLSQETADTHATGRRSMRSLLAKNSRLELLELTGMITMESASEGGGLFKNDSNAMQVRKALDAAAKDNSIKGVLLRIDSPGGTVAMSQELNAAVQRVRAKKPVVVSMGDLTASGGYYTACAADKIVANPGTLTASIGVIISSLDFSSLMTQKLGVQPVTIKSGKFKDILSPYRKPTPEDRTLLQTIINVSYQDFLHAVIAGRTRLITNARVKAERIATIKSIADGRVVTGSQALQDGLVDELGDQDHAWTLLSNLAKARFNLSNKDRLPLDEADQNFSILEMLGLGGASSSAQALNPLAQAAHVMPLSMRYPNQPLWVME